MTLAGIGYSRQRGERIVQMNGYDLSNRYIRDLLYFDIWKRRSQRGMPNYLRKAYLKHSVLYVFRCKEAYVTISQLAIEGMAVGTIILGVTLFHVSISLGEMPTDD